MKDKYANHFRWALTVMSVMAFGIIFFFFVFRMDAILSFFKKVSSILSPVILGTIIAYLLSPIVSRLSRWLTSFLTWCKVPPRIGRFISKALAITVSLGALLVGVTVLIVMIAPELYSSIVKLVGDFRNYGTIVYNFIATHVEANTEILAYIQEFLNSFTDWVYNWITNDLLKQMQSVMSGLTVGIVGVVNIATTLVVGIVISVYLLVSKDTFLGQIKKLVYTIWKPETANIILSISRQVNKIFGGFISGKLIDSLIIGILCFIGVSILNMPYPLLISVIVGVTNVIPFFGPYIGAIPSAFLVLIASPSKCLIFLIFILLLQQIDGNIIGPAILGDSTGLSPFWVVVAILLGGGLFGFFGMLLGVPTFAVIFFLLKTFADYHLKKNKLPTESSAYCRIEKIDPETGTLIYLKKRRSDQPHHQSHGLLEAFEKASAAVNRRRKEDQLPETPSATQTQEDNTSSGKE